MRSSKKQPVDDLYWGSGSNRICCSAKKHKGEGFCKEILAQDVINRKELARLESCYVTAFLLETDRLCLNRRPGGEFELTPEMIAKIRNSRLGRQHSEESKRKMSEARSGGTSWNKGIPTTIEHKKKISDALIGKPASNKDVAMSQETKQKLAAKNTGKKASEETKKKMSDAMLGKKHSDESKIKMSIIQKGKVVSKETCQKISKSKLGQTSPNKGKQMSPEQKDKLSKSLHAFYAKKFEEQQIDNN